MSNGNRRDVVALHVRERGAAARPVFGFTMIELLITIGVAAIFAMLALPSFVETVRNSRMQTTAEQLYTDILMARREAIKRNKKVLLCPARAGAVPGNEDLCNADKTKWADGWVVCYATTNASPPDCKTSSATDPNPVIRRNRLDSALYVDPALGPKYIAFEANGKAGNDTSNAASKLKIAGNWSGASASWFVCTQASGNVTVKMKKKDDSSDPC